MLPCREKGRHGGLEATGGEMLALGWMHQTKKDTLPFREALSPCTAEREFHISGRSGSLRFLGKRRRRLW